jgi:2-methylcitrate dehydratase PrpD
VQPYVDAEIDRDWRRNVTPAKVTVQFRDGETIEARVDYPKGHPRNVMTEAEFVAKTTDCATFAARLLPSDTAAPLIAEVGTLESLPDTAGVLRIIA